MAGVELLHVGKVYPNGTQALDDCTLEVTDGELLVLVGPSGCGKSTVLRLIAGLEDATAGEIRIGGTLVNDLPPQARNVAMVFQDYALYPHMTVRRNLEFPLRMRGSARADIDQRVATVARQLGIEALLERLPKQLSGGQRQRVAMGRALVREPAVSLLDEPLSNLDAKLRVDVRAEIAELQRRTATTMLYVTHDQVEAMTLGDRVALLNGGRLQQVASPRELYERPASAFVAGFIGNPPMNLLPGRLIREPSGRALVGVAGGTLPLAPTHLPRHWPADDAVTVGIRPETPTLAAAHAPGVLTLGVEHVEWLGHETLAHLRARSHDGRVVVRLPGMHALTAGQPIALTVDPERIYLFDTNGRALTT
jgi:ABC-type sugar transport system ATPase subunit